MSEGQGRWLVIETSGRSGSVAVGEGDRVQCCELSEGRRHARDMTAAVSDLLSQEGWGPADLTGVIVGIGPGSYTGLRVGLMSAKALAYTTGCRLVTVETFRVVAERAPAEAFPLDVIGDAQQDQVYYQRFGREGADDPPRPLGDLRIVALQEWLDSGVDAGWVSGPGVAVFGEQIVGRRRPVVEALCQPTAEAAYRVGLRRAAAGEFADIWTSEPIYLRGSYAEEQAKKSAPAAGAE